MEEKQKPNVDGEARWVIKAGKPRFGFKRHTLTDANGLIVADVTTSANESDMSHFVDVIDKASLPRGAIVLADKGYASKANREALKARGLRDGIMHKASKGMRLTEEQREKNLSISRFRYRVERTFGSMRLWFKAGIARYVGLAKTTAQHLMEALAYNLYRTPGIIMSRSL